MVKSLTFKVKRSLEVTTLTEYKKNHVVQYTITICFWIMSIEQLYRLLGKCSCCGHLNLKMQLLESLIVLNFEIHAIHLL